MPVASRFHESVRRNRVRAGITFHGAITKDNWNFRLRSRNHRIGNAAAHCREIRVEVLSRANRVHVRCRIRVYRELIHRRIPNIICWEH